MRSSSPMGFTWRRTLSWGMLALCIGLHPWAQAKEDKKARAQMERIQRLQEAQQNLEQEKTQLSAEKAEMEGQLKSTRAELDRARASVRREAGLKRDVETLRSEKDGLAAKVSELERVLNETRQQLAQSQSSVQQERLLKVDVQGRLDRQTRALSACDARTAGLYKLNADLLSRYEQAASRGGSFWRGGAFTQLDRVRVENSVADGRDQLDELAPSGVPTP